MAQAPTPDFSGLDRVTLGHLWWTLNLASVLASLAHAHASDNPLLAATLEEFEAQLARTETMRRQLLLDLNAQALAAIDYIPWD